MDASLHQQDTILTEPTVDGRHSLSKSTIVAVNDSTASNQSLSNYIGIGSLVLSLADGHQAVQGHGESSWQELYLGQLMTNYQGWEVSIRLAVLMRSGWLRVFTCSSTGQPFEIWRIYILADDVARSSVDGRSKRDARVLQHLFPSLDTTVSTWNGQLKSAKDVTGPFDPWAEKEDCSLFYLFNTLESPSPDPSVIKNLHLQHSVEKLLESEHPPWGLKTILYPYQRRCAAMMIQKENAQGLQLDPRLEVRKSPTGDVYYYGPRDGVFMKSPRYYETCQGGILAETMGLGKTLVCIAVIMMTRGQYPEVPVEYERSQRYSQTPSLADLAATAVAKQGLPWKTFFEDQQDATDSEFSQCKSIMDRQRPTYEIPPRIIRSMRHVEKRGPPEEVLLCHGTIVVVPANLVHQWQTELSTHTKEGSLKVLVMKEAKIALPPPRELAQYDVVLFSRRRFELESRAIVEVEYTSPLKKLHWLRIIIDEGHGFSSSVTNAAVVAEKLVKAERRWVVTGTPARDLLGVEVDVPAMTGCETEEDFQLYKESSLEMRKSFDEVQERKSGAVKSIGALASRFLQAKPWCLSPHEEGAANWDEYIYRHEDYVKRTFTGFSRCLRATLGDLMIKTRPEDVDKDIRLPPLRHEVIRLEPSLLDKMTANLFVLLYTTNAVTSERRDQDYLFHSNSRDHLQRLTRNLRHSAFYWLGFSDKDVHTSVETGKKYLDKHGVNCTNADRELLGNTMEAAQRIVSSPYWKALTSSQEMGIFLEDWPSGSEATWAFDGCYDPLMMGLAQTIDAQKFVNNQLATDEPLSGFNETGNAALLKAQEEEIALANGTLVKEEDKLAKSAKAGIPTAGYGDGMGSKRISVTGTSKATPKNLKRGASQVDNQGNSTAAKSTPRKKRKLSIGNTAIDLAPSDPLGRTRIVGTASAKFSYIVDLVSTLHEEEKILIFYDADHVAYYISQALDLLDIKHLIYSNTLNAEQRSKYIVLFNNDPSQRVLIMDLKQAAHGLNLSSASRVFFINPPWRPDVEAQAIKRAHRIGQTRPVHVETLVLKGTVEEAMFERAAKMSRREHLAAKNLEEDEDMRHIIQNARILPIAEREMTSSSLMAPLCTPQQLFGRPGRAGKSKKGKLEEEVFGADDSPDGAAKRRRKETGVSATKGKGKAKATAALDGPTEAGAPSTLPGPSVMGKSKGKAKSTDAPDKPTEDADTSTLLGPSAKTKGKGKARAIIIKDEPTDDGDAPTLPGPSNWQVLGPKVLSTPNHGEGNASSSAAATQSGAQQSLFGGGGVDVLTGIEASLFRNAYHQVGLEGRRREL